MLNINLDRNRELMERCSTLYGYSYLIAEIQNNMKHGLAISEAIDQAVTVCIKNGILEEYLNKHRAEVCTMIMTEYNKELHERTLREEGRVEGRVEGRLEGEANFTRLFKLLKEQDRLDDFEQSIYDKTIFDKLKVEFGIE